MLGRSHINLTSLDPISPIELTAHGEVARSQPPRPRPSQQLSVSIRFTRSGWFLVRAVATVDLTFGFAPQAPFHVEAPAGPRRVRRDSAQFLVDRIKQRTGRIRPNLTDPHQLRAALSPQDRSRALCNDMAAGSATD